MIGLKTRATHLTKAKSNCDQARFSALGTGYLYLRQILIG